MEQDANLPTIRLKEETGVMLLSILLKAINPLWGNNDNQISKMVLDYFKFMPLNPSFTDTINHFQQDGVPEWVLYQLALVYNHAERSQFVLGYIHKQTEIPLERLQFYQDVLLKTLAGFKIAVDSSPLRQLFASYQMKDTQQRLEEIEMLKAELGALYKFFRPNLKQMEFIFTPSDPLFSEYIGYDLRLTDNQLVFVTHDHQIKAQIYQVLRFILKPILKRVVDGLTAEQKVKLHQQASGKVRQFYGESPEQLLMAEMITIYYNNIRTNLPIEDFQAFSDRIGRLTDRQFLQSLEVNRSLRERCRYMNVHNLTEFKAILKPYYDMFIRDELSFKIFQAYQNYQIQHPNISFEQFAVNNLTKIL